MSVPPWLNTPGVGLPVNDAPLGFVRAMRAPEVSAIAYPPDMVFGRPNCGLVALAIASNMPLGHVEEWFRKYGRRDGKGFNANWKGYTFHTRYSAYLTSRWIKHVFKALPRPMSVAAFAQDTATTGKLYVARVRGHVLTTKSGWVCDQYGNVKGHAHKYKRSMVTCYWEIA